MFEAKKKAYLSSMNSTNREPHQDFDTRNGDDFSPLMALHLKDGAISEKSLEEQIIVLLGIGHESMASTIANVILMLAIHPAIQERVFNELGANNSHDASITIEKLQSLQLLDRVVKETLRLYPSFHTFLRTSTSNVSLLTCTVPKGVPIVLSAYTMHRVKHLKFIGIFFVLGFIYLVNFIFVET